MHFITSFFCRLQKNFDNFTRRRTGGFSLVELVIAVAIIVTLSTTFLFNYGNFDRRVTVDILAHQIASWIHDAQVSAMSIRRSQTGVSPTEQFRVGYGLHFDTATPNQFIYFADIDRDRAYDPPGVGLSCGDASVECEETITLLNGNVVSLLCGNSPVSEESPNCTSGMSGDLSLYETGMLDIVFARPNPFDATIWGDLGTAYSNAEITVSSPKGYRHTISVWTTGQVSVR